MNDEWEGQNDDSDGSAGSHHQYAAAAARQQHRTMNLMPDTSRYPNPSDILKISRKSTQHWP